ncbi:MULTISPECIES: glycosyltransferase [Butyricimonas]|uniref:Glycosyltransferase n=1 Tax=Butyricimonas hominis TaxID=2763032 RepID=A0ABR7CZJ4_9BACT|nr:MULTISPECIES: glycosyltransferase [Butyricimonas]MBC5620740.1 glycosyltransferase [Butyricimonas hominis]MCB6970925.1 glycosyltransferase [Butyricimonas synergistica]MCG4517639.1 glycosyltransferase [Butyricimonas sp. DFI.6.44]
MYILMISRGYPSLKDPQWGGFERDQAEALKRSGHKVVVLSVDRRFRFYWRKIGITSDVINGIPIFNSFLLPSAFFRIWGEKIFFKIFSIQMDRLYRKVQAKYGKPDIIYSHYLYNTAVATDLKCKYKIPLVGIEHWSKLNNDKLSKYLKFLGKKAYGGADVVIAVSKSLANRIDQHFKKKAVVIHNMVNASFFERSQYFPKKGVFSFITVGNLFPIKGHDLLIEAFKKACFDDHVELKIIGDGRLRFYLEQLVDKYRLNRQVKFLGKRNKEDIKEFLNSSNVFVLSSIAENFSVALLEGLASGLPAIATLCGGTDECINESNGILVPVKNVNALAEAMKQMVMNYSQYDKEKIREECKNDYSPDVIVDKLIYVFNGVLVKY